MEKTKRSDSLGLYRKNIHVCSHLIINMVMASEALEQFSQWKGLLRNVCSNNHFWWRTVGRRRRLTTPDVITCSV